MADAAAHLRELDARSHVGDLGVNGACDPGRRTVEPFEELVDPTAAWAGRRPSRSCWRHARWTGGRRLDGPAAIHELLRGGLGE